MKRILIVEDDRWLAEMYRDVLQNDFAVTICHDAQSAIEALDEARPGMILLDVMLPGGNGLAFLQELRSYDDMAAVPVLVCSSVGFSSQQRRALEHFAPLALIDKSELTPNRLKEALSKAYATE